MIKINLLPGGDGLVWDTQDIMTLRREYRVVGGLSGTLGRHAQQNQYLGRPLWLSREEVEYLRSSMEPTSLALFPNDDASIMDHASHMDRRAYYESIHSTLFFAYIDKLRLKLELKKARLQSRDGDTQEADISFDDELQRLNDTEGLHRRCDESFDMYWEPYIGDGEDDTCKDGPSVLGMVKHIGELLDDSQLNLLLEVPRLLEQRTEKDLPILEDGSERSKLLRYLWSCTEQLDGRSVRFYLTSGQKFGGDYCMYVGDPVRFHAAGIVHLVDYDEHGAKETMTMQDLVVFGRVSNVTRKTSMLVSNRPDGDVCLQSLEWMGW
jgi:tRNA-splicing endonuclease subunit Sen34